MKVAPLLALMFSPLYVPVSVTVMDDPGAGVSSDTVTVVAPCCDPCPGLPQPIPFPLEYPRLTGSNMAKTSRARTLTIVKHGICAHSERV